MDDNNQTVKTPSYKLRLEGEGITLNRELTEEVALAVINVALGGAPTAAPSPRTGGAGGAAATPARASSGETPGEFIESLSATTNGEKIVAFGAFLHDDRGQADFTREDIKAMFRAAHESPPANFPRDFRAALASNEIAEEGSTERYFVTKTGRKALENKFAAPRTTRRTRRRGGRNASGDDGD